VEVLLVKFSNKTSVPSAFLIVSLAAARGTSAREQTSSQLEGVDGVVGGDVKPRLFEECARAKGWDRRSNSEIVWALRTLKSGRWIQGDMPAGSPV
jgi:hypothetical protein